MAYAIESKIDSTEGWGECYFPADFGIDTVRVESEAYEHLDEIRVTVYPYPDEEDKIELLVQRDKETGGLIVQNPIIEIRPPRLDVPDTIE